MAELGGRARRRRDRGSPPWSTSAAGRSSPTCAGARRSSRDARLAPADPVPRGHRRGAGPPVRERPPPAPAAGRRPARSTASRAERELLRDLRGEADVVIDTSDLNVHELGREGRGRVRRRGRARRCGPTVMSFGFKYGLPLDADLVVDVRFLPNPYWVPELRPLTGATRRSRDYVLAQAGRRRVPRPLRRAAASRSPRATSARASAT